MNRKASAPRPTVVIAVALAGLFGSGCSRDSVAPPAEPLRLELTVSAPTGDPSHPVTVHARVTNLGGAPLQYYMDCVGPGMLLLSDPDERHLNQLCGICPNVACPLCAPMMGPLQPGKSREQVLVFDGTLHDCDGPFAGSPGAYRVEAAFSGTDPQGVSHEVSGVVNFTWSSGN